MSSSDATDSAPIAAQHALAGRLPVVAVLVGVLMALAFGVAGLLQLQPVSRLDRYLLDTLMVHTATGAPARDAVVVDIDEVSLSSLGQWPWPRYRVAQLIERIAAGHPAAIAMDIVFPEPDRVSLSDIRQTFKRDFDLDVAFSGVPDGLLDNDGYLGQVMSRANVVGARYFYFDHQTAHTAAPRPGVGMLGRVDLLAPDRATGMLDNIPAIASQTRSTGFVNSALDADGLLRRLPLLIQYHGVVYPSLALAASMRALGVDAGVVESGTDGLSIRLGHRRIPVDRSGRALLRFNGASSRYASLSAVSVLSGGANLADLRGKIVFIGSSAMGLHDVHATVMDREFSGLKIQAAMAQNIIDGNALRLPAWSGKVALLLGLLAALVFCILFADGCSMARLAALSALWGLALLATMLAVFVRDGMYLAVGVPLLVPGALLVLAFVARFVTNQRHAQRWRRQLENAHRIVIESMAAVAETRDPETGAHIKRTQHYVRAIARQLRRTGQHVQTLSDEYIKLLFLSAPLHDIGKVGVPDHILLKPGPLAPDELVIMHAHAEFGRRIISSMAEHIDGDNFLLIAADIAGTHHEKWDGSGYPDGLGGQDIPLSGRIMAVADIYDALISRRCYKDPFPHARAVAMMHELRGTTFDPAVLDAFCAIETEILQIAAHFRDDEEQAASDTARSIAKSLLPLGKARASSAAPGLPAQ